MTLRSIAIVPLVLTLILVGLSIQLIRNHLAFTQLETEVSFWGRGTYMPTDQTRAQTARGIAQLVEATPKDARAHNVHASQLAWEAYWQQDRSLDEASKKAAQQALDWRPIPQPDDKVGAGTRFDE